MVLTIYPSHCTFTLRRWIDTRLTSLSIELMSFGLLMSFAGNCIDIIKAFPVCGIQEQFLPNIVHKTYIKEDDKYLLDITGYVCQSSKTDEIIKDALLPIKQSNGDFFYRFPSNLDWMSSSLRKQNKWHNTILVVKAKFACIHGTWAGYYIKDTSKKCRVAQSKTPRFKGFGRK